MDDIKIFKRFLNDVRHLKDFEYFKQLDHNRIYKNKRRQICKIKPRRPRFNPMEEMNEIEFRKKYRYTKENMRRIIEIVRDDLEVDYYQPMKRNQVPIDLQILSAIRFFGGTEVCTYIFAYKHTYVNKYISGFVFIPASTTYGYGPWR